jgi:hypothetical protein
MHRINMFFAAAMWLAGSECFGAVNLLDRYPTALTAGDTSAENARAWEFDDPDIFHVSKFSFAAGDKLRIDCGEADLGIGHCRDGAVWAVLVPRGEAELKSAQGELPEPLGHVWLRFHPREIATLFPPETVFSNGNTTLKFRISAIANAKMNASWQAGGKALIPERKDVTIDTDTTAGVRRFFIVDTAARTNEYIGAFEKRAIKQPAAITPALAQQAFDQLWEAFDREYAMFVLRPDVDWTRLRDQYRLRAVACKSTAEFGGICAEMLRSLRDLHVWLTVSGNQVPVFNRERTANANPAAFRRILGELKRSGPMDWTITADRIGFISIYGWNGSGLPGQFDTVLDKMRGTNTSGLVLDVRLNGGGSEDLARKVAGRFLEKEFVYAFSQFRSGPNHTNLTEKYSRSVQPRGPWRYEHPVVLLIGQKCMSSSESFVAMMSGAPQVTIMGDHTCGSSGNPKIVQLPLAMTVSVPRWIDYLPEGTPLDEKGMVPTETFRPGPNAFTGEHDDLLSAALQLVRKKGGG